MKRNAPIVEYPSSSESDDNVIEKTEIAQPPPKRRKKLPALSSTLVGPAHIDNPALHDGRVRTAPHVEGQFAAYIYVPVKLGRKLLPFLRNVHHYAKSILPCLYPIPKDLHEVAALDSDADLHVSISRPIYLRSHQREELKQAVCRIAKSHISFEASFAAFSELQNDERTRTFLTVEIGAGHSELQVMSETLIPTLRAIRQKEFYSAPRFHASVGWALLSSGPSGLSPTEDASGTSKVSSLPENLVPTLQQEFGKLLLTKSIGSFEVDSLCVKIGKEIHRYKLSSS